MNLHFAKNLWLQDIRKREYAVGIIQATGLTGLMLYVFYESILPAPLFIPVWIVYLKNWLEDISKKKEQ